MCARKGLSAAAISNATAGVFFYNASRGNLTALSSLTFLTPMFAALAGYIVLGETFTPLQLTGAHVSRPSSSPSSSCNVIASCSREQVHLKSIMVRTMRCTSIQSLHTVLMHVTW